MIRKALILLMLAGILATAGMSLLILDTEEGRAIIKGAIQQEVEDATGLTLYVGDVEVRPFRSELELTDVRVDGRGAPRMAGAVSVVFGLAPLQLLGGTVTVSRLEVVQPFVDVTVRDGWIVGIPRLPEDKGPTQKLSEDMFFRLFVRHFRMAGLRVHVRVDGKHPVDMDLRELRAVLDARDNDTHAGTFSLGKGRITLPNGKVATLESVDGEATVHGEGLLRPEQLDLAHARMQLDRIFGELQGTVRFAPLSTGLLPATDLTVTGRLDLQQFNAYVPQLLPMEGSAEFGAHVRSAFGGRNPSLTGSGEIKAMEVNGFWIGTWTGDFVADPSGMDFSNVRSIWGDADVLGHGHVDFGKDFKEVRAAFGAKGSHGSFHTGMAHIQVPGSWVEFNVDAELEFEGTLYPEMKFTGEGDALLTNFRVYNQDARKARPDDVMVAIGPVTGHSRMEFDFTHFSFVQGTLSDGKTTVTGDVYLPLGLDTEFWVEASADPVARPGETMNCATFSPVGPVHLTCNGPGRVHVRGMYWDPKVWGEADLKDVSVEGYRLGDASGRFDYHNLLLRFLDVKGQLKETSWEGKADLNWRAYLGQGPDGKPLKRKMTRRDTIYVTVEARNVV